MIPRYVANVNNMCYCAYGMSEHKKNTRLYRLENPNIPVQPNGITSHEDIVGQWFTPNLDAALIYLRKSTQTFGSKAKIIDGARLIMADMPTDRLTAYHVSQRAIASSMDVENDNYILPRDGTIPMKELELDNVVGVIYGGSSATSPS